jgi:hypothetical protein
MITYHRWIGNVFLKVVVTSNPQWYKEYPPQAFNQLIFGNTVERHSRYIFIASDEELAERGFDLDSVIQYWEDRISEALNG